MANSSPTFWVDPDKPKLIKYRGKARARIFDADGEEFEATFNNDGCINIDTTDRTFIGISPTTMGYMLDLIEEAEVYYERYLEKHKDE